MEASDQLLQPFPRVGQRYGSEIEVVRSDLDNGQFDAKRALGQPFGRSEVARYFGGVTNAD
jgi:hypothetical protein